jgi:hypothetical protein
MARVRVAPKPIEKTHNVITRLIKQGGKVKEKN